MSDKYPFAEPFTCSMVTKTVTISGLEVTLSGSPGPLYCEQHVKENCGGFIPTVADWFRNIRPESWMSRGYRIEPAAEPCPPLLPTRQRLTPRPRQQRLTATPHPEPATGRF